VTIERLQAHYGFSRMPFGRDLAPGMLHRHSAHNEAVARITWCVAPMYGVCDADTRLPAKRAARGVGPVPAGQREAALVS
jgi:hypothetical protein